MIAVQVVAKALNAMGGVPAWQLVNDAEVVGTCKAGELLGGGTTSIRWTVSGPEFRYETDTVNAGPILLSGHGSPVISSTMGNTHLFYEYGRRRLPFHLPGLPLMTVLNGSATYSLVLLGTDSITGINAVHVRITEHRGPAKLQGAQQDWWFDPSSGLPVQVTYLLPSEDNTHYIHLTANYNAWKQESSILVPLQLSTTFEGQFVQQSCTIQTVVTNQNPLPSVFDAR